MIGVYITINGTTIFARTAVNRLKEHGVYIGDDGNRIEHDPEDGAVALAIKMLQTIESDPDELSLCNRCYCMTKTVDSKCGKCGANKVFGKVN